MASIMTVTHSLTPKILAVGTTQRTPEPTIRTYSTRAEQHRSVRTVSIATTTEQATFRAISVVAHALITMKQLHGPNVRMVLITTVTG